VADRIAVIVNNAAGCGYGPDWAESVTGKFRAAGMDAGLEIVHGGAEIAAATRKAIAEGVPTIVAGGGDGTVNAVASSLIGSEIRLGVLPLGTLNHFAKDLKIPLQLDQAIDNIVAGHCVRIDAGEVNGRIFINNSGIGLYPEIVATRDAERRRSGIGKWRALFRASVEVLRRYPFLETRLTVDGQRQDRRTPCVFVGNNQYGTRGFGIGERKSLDAGVLSVYVVESPNRWAFFALLVRSLFGRPHPTQELETLLTTELVIETRHRHKRVATDGEVTDMQTPLRYRILPRALSVLAPPAPTAMPER
jgi:YegS/Rv2252/BmrU family lipid kinase